MRNEPKEPLAPISLQVAALALAWVPHAARFPLWFSGTMALLLAARLGLAWGGLGLPGRWVLLPATGGASVWVITQFRPFFGGNGAIALLTVMIVLKLFEVRERRDRIVSALLGFVLAATRFTYEQTPFAALWMFGLALIFTYILVESADEERSMGVGEKMRVVARLFLLSAPVTLLLFLVFPRAGAPLFTIQGSSHGVTGLSEEMSPGSVTSLVLSEEIVFRGQLSDSGGVNPELYWRGPVLEEFDGVTWRVRKKGDGGPFPKQVGNTIAQVLVVQPGVKWVTPLDYPSAVDGGVAISPDGVVKAGRAGTSTTTYNALSLIRPSFEELDGERRNLLLKLPEGADERVLSLARKFRAGPVSDRETADRMLAFFQLENFVYTLRPEPLGTDPVADFLFRTRQGFCEHYASAMAVLLRHAGIPSRVVTGYLGGEYNPFGGHWIVQELHSHAWVEAWLEGRGWTRLDPTAAVSPERVRAGIDRAASLTSGYIRFGFGRSGLVTDIRLAADYLGFWWEDWVVGFGQEKQRRLLKGLGLEGRTGFAALLAATIAAPVLFLLLLGAVYARWKRRSRDPVDRFWERFLRKLEKKGIVKEPHEPPEAFAQRAAALMPERAREISAAVGIYVRCRYGRAPTPGDLAEFKKAVDSFEAKSAKG